MIFRKNFVRSRVVASLGVVALLICNPQSVRAQRVSTSTPPAPLSAAATLDDYVAWALATNPDLLALSARHKAEKEIPAQVGALPDPKLMVGYFVEPVETRVGPQKAAVTLSQTLPFFGKRGLAGAVAEANAAMSGQMYEGAILDLARDVKHAYYDYFRVYRLHDITKREEHTLRQIENLARTQYTTGNVSQADVLNAQLELSRLRKKLIEQRAELVVVKSRLNTLLNRVADATLATPELHASNMRLPDLDDLTKRARTVRPEIHHAATAIEKAQKAASLAHRDYYPDLNLSLSYVWVDEALQPVADSGQDVLQVAASINLPIWLGKRRAAVREAEAHAAAARHQRDALTIRIENDVHAAYEQANATQALVALYEDALIPQAEQHVAVLRAGYETGRADFLSLMDGERALLAIKSEQVRRTAEFGKSVADLERTAGGPIAQQELERTPR